jgi:transcriptional regulator with XRE-family HTH domain
VPDRRTPREILQSIAANVVRARKRRGLSQEELAEAAGLDVRAIQRMERAEINFGVVALVRVSAALDVATTILVRSSQLSPARPGRPPKTPSRR